MAAVAIDSTDVCWAGGVHFSCPRITLLPRLLSLHGVLGAGGRMNICAGGIWLKEHHGAVMVTRRKARGEPAGALGGRTFWQEPAPAGANLALSDPQDSKRRPQASPTASNSQFRFPRQTQSSIFSDFAVMLPPDVDSHPWHLCMLTFKPHPTRQEKHPETLSQATVMDIVVFPEPELS